LSIEAMTSLIPPPLLLRGAGTLPPPSAVEERLEPHVGKELASGSGGIPLS
jgi:hypothetical protein